MFKSLFTTAVFCLGAAAQTPPSDVFVLRNINLAGLPEEVKADVLSRLNAAGIREGQQQLTSEGLRLTAETVANAFPDQHLSVQIRRIGADQADLYIGKPGGGPIRIGGNVASANLLFQAKPVYPEVAKAAGVQGTVQFSVLIGTDGHLARVNLVSGHPALVKAAMDAVQQWVYKPTLLNGEPVEVQTTIDINFTLSQ